jgi:hypothetical protein
MKSPSIYKLKDLLKIVNQIQTCIKGKWVPARPLGLSSLVYRFRCTWLVFTGQADVLIWPEDQ